jgi:hypothetical protein
LRGPKVFKSQSVGISKGLANLGYNAFDIGISTRGHSISIRRLEDELSSTQAERDNRRRETTQLFTTNKQLEGNE